MKRPRIALVRGKFLNRFDGQAYEPLLDSFDITAYASLTPIHTRFAFPVVRLPSPMDVPELPLKMPVLNRVFTDAQYLYGLERRLAGQDIAHAAETYYRYTAQCLDAKRRGLVKRVISTVWETIPHNNEGIRGRRAYKRRALEELDHIIAVTDRARKALVAEGADPARITVIGASVDTSRFTPRNTEGHADRTTRILFCGRLEREKGVTDLLEALRIIAYDPGYAGRAYDVRLIGTGSLEREIRSRAAGFSANWRFRISQVPYEHMPDEYRNADIFVAPSKPAEHWEEQYGMVLLEAQASGLPIVTTTSGAIPENVGDAAVMVEPGNPRDLARELSSFIGLPAKRDRYGKKARARAEQIHDIRHGARAIGRIYTAVLAS